MKRGTPDHPKTKEFAELLGVRRVTALGHLELLFHFTANYAPAGDIGRYSDKRIAAALDWTGRPEKVIAALQQAGFIESHPTHRLVVHDWHVHADAAVRKRLDRAKMAFVCSQQHTGQVTRQPDPLLRTKSPSSRALSKPTPMSRPTPSSAADADEGGRGVENGVENSTAATPEEIAALLAGYMKSQPDAKIVERVRRAANGATYEALAEFLRLKYTRGCKPGTRAGPRGWAWFPIVVAQEFGGVER